MNVLLISTNRSQHPGPVIPHGACMVADSAARSGHQVTMLDLMFSSDPDRAIASTIKKFRPDVIGISVRNIDNNDLHSPVFYLPGVRSCIQTIRSLTHVPIVLGGAALTVMPGEILRYTGASLGVLGDGEKTFPDLLDRLSRRARYDDLPGIATITNGVYTINAPEPLCSAPWRVPDFHRWIDVRRYRVNLSTIPLQTKLGCPFQCIYCTYRKIEGAPYRLLDPDQAGEIATDLASRGVRDIEFVDNVFNAPYDHALAVCESIIRARPRVRFQSVELNPYLFTDELVIVMERAGFSGMGMTVESASDPVLHLMKKGFTARDVHAAADTIRRHRLPCIWIFLLGGPGETEGTVRETLRFAEQAVRPQDAAFFNIGIRIYPGTELESMARREGVLTVRPDDMLEPVFYCSPQVNLGSVVSLVRDALNRNMNFMSGESLNFRYLPVIHRLGYRIGLRSPLWRYTRVIRRGLRIAGMDV